jgi:hypothetical protein
MAWPRPSSKPSSGDYTWVSAKPDAASVLRQLDSWFERYNTVHPHKALGYRSPREFRKQIVEKAIENAVGVGCRPHESTMATEAVGSRPQPPQAVARSASLDATAAVDHPNNYSLSGLSGVTTRPNGTAAERCAASATARSPGALKLDHFVKSDAGLKPPHRLVKRGTPSPTKREPSTNPRTRYLRLNELDPTSLLSRPTAKHRRGAFRVLHDRHLAQIVARSGVNSMPPSHLHAGRLQLPLVVPHYQHSLPDGSGPG